MVARRFAGKSVIVMAHLARHRWHQPTLLKGLHGSIPATMRGFSRTCTERRTAEPAVGEGVSNKRL
jgi:hypothetical protein